MRQEIPAGESQRALCACHVMISQEHWEIQKCFELRNDTNSGTNIAQGNVGYGIKNEFVRIMNRGRDLNYIIFTEVNVGGKTDEGGGSSAGDINKTETW